MAVTPPWDTSGPATAVATPPWEAKTPPWEQPKATPAPWDLAKPGQMVKELIKDKDGTLIGKDDKAELTGDFENSFKSAKVGETFKDESGSPFTKISSTSYAFHPPEKETPSSSIGGAFLRNAGGTAITEQPGNVGFVTGMAGAEGLAAPLINAIPNPTAQTIARVGTGLAGGMGGAILASDNPTANGVAPFIDQDRLAADQQLHPWASNAGRAVGEIAGMIPTFGVGKLAPTLGKDLLKRVPTAVLGATTQALQEINNAPKGKFMEEGAAERIAQAAGVAAFFNKEARLGKMLKSDVEGFIKNEVLPAARALHPTPTGNPITDSISTPATGTPKEINAEANKTAMATPGQPAAVAGDQTNPLGHIEDSFQPAKNVVSGKFGTDALSKPDITPSTLNEARDLALLQKPPQGQGTAKEGSSQPAINTRLASILAGADKTEPIIHGETDTKGLNDVQSNIGMNVNYQGYSGQLARDESGKLGVWTHVNEAGGKPRFVEVSDSLKGDEGDKQDIFKLGIQPVSRISGNDLIMGITADPRSNPKSLTYNPFAVKTLAPLLGSLYGLTGKDPEERRQRAMEGMLFGYAAEVGGNAIGHYRFDLTPRMVDLGAAGWHVSPHDFDKFDLNKVGTGEGSQVFGWGGYLAENTGTKDAYMQSLARNKLYVNGQEYGSAPALKQVDVDNPSAAKQLAARAVITAHTDDPGSTIKQVIRNTYDTWSKYREDLVNSPDTRFDSKIYDKKIQQADAVLKELTYLHDQKDVQKKEEIHEYKLNFKANPDTEIIHWDNPISDQKGVQDKIEKVPGLTEALKDVKNPTGEDVYNAAETLASSELKDRSTVASFIPNSGDVAKRASQMLNEAGIKGVKFLDQGSRWGSDNPSHNYVFFNDKDIEITHKDGKEMTLADAYKQAGMPETAGRPAPAKYLGHQDDFNGGPGFPLYNLTEDIPGHPKGSTVGADTLIKAGFTIPKGDGERLASGLPIIPGLGDKIRAYGARLAQEKLSAQQPSDALSIQKPDALPLLNPAGNSQGLGENNPQPEVPSGAQIRTPKPLPPSSQVSEAVRGTDKYRERLTTKIENLYKKTSESSGVDASFRTRTAELFENSTGLKPEDIDKLLKSTMPTSALDGLYEKLKQHNFEGRMAQYDKRVASAVEKQGILNELASGQANKITDTPIANRAGQDFSITEKINNSIGDFMDRRRNGAQNWWISKQFGDVFIDHADGDQNGKGPLFRNFISKPDLANQIKTELKDNFNQPIVDVIKKYNLSKVQLAQVDIYAKTLTRGGIKHLLDSGLTAQDIQDRTKNLSEGQMDYYKTVRKILDEEVFPRVQKLMRDEYNIDVKKEDNYWPITRDYTRYEAPQNMPQLTIDKGGQGNIDEMSSFRKLFDDYQMRRTTKADQGFTESRVENAGGATKIGHEVIEQHLNDASHLLAFQHDLKTLGEVARSPLIEQKYGNLTQEWLKNRLDTLARFSGPAGSRRIAWMDWLSKNNALATLAFRLWSELKHAGNVFPYLQHLGVEGLIRGTGETLAKPAMQKGSDLLNGVLQKLGFDGMSRGLSETSNPDYHKWIKDNFSEEYNRFGGERSIYEMAQGKDKRDKLGSFGFFPERALDAFYARAAVGEAYRQNLESRGIDASDYMDKPIDETARNFAHYITRKIVTPVSIKDLPHALSRGELFGGNMSATKMWYQFQTTMLRQTSNLYHDVFNLGYKSGIKSIKEGDTKGALAAASAAALSTLAFIGMKATDAGMTRLSRATLHKIMGTQEKKEPDNVKDWQQYAADIIKNIPDFGPPIATALSFGKASSGFPALDSTSQIGMGIGKLSTHLGKGKGLSDIQVKKDLADIATGASGDFLGVPGSATFNQYYKEGLNKK